MAWLYEQVFGNADERKPHYAEQSALNWLRALRFETEREHGATVAEQMVAVRRAIRAETKMRGEPLAIGRILEPMVGGITNCMALLRLARLSPDVPWVRPSAAVIWYYALYGSVRAILATVGHAPAENHGAGMNAYVGVLRKRMPHPFDMLASHVRNEEYACTLPYAPFAVPFNINESFVASASLAQGMILQYLSGTADWYTERTKAKLRERKKIVKFNTADARRERDRALEKTLGFMHVAFRYRGKANYRDHIYLTYGRRELSTANVYIEDLAVTARFLVLVALAFAEWHVGKDITSTFIADLHVNLRRGNVATPEELFWRSLPE